MTHSDTLSRTHNPLELAAEMWSADLASLLAFHSFRAFAFIVVSKR